MELTDSFETYISAYHPVCVLCHVDYITARRLHAGSGFAGSDEVPAHLKEWADRHPGEPIDPERPPPVGLIRATMFLRQERLPGCLLGGWQFEMLGADRGV